MRIGDHCQYDQAGEAEKEKCDEKSFSGPSRHISRRKIPQWKLIRNNNVKLTQIKSI